MIIILIVILGTCNVINSQLPERIFQPYKYPFPCFTNEYDKWIEKGKDLKGFVFIKVPKTGSSTLSGITLRIGNKHKLSHFKNDARCSVVYNHRKATQLGVKDRVREKTFLWTFIREPSSQIQSNFFWQWRMQEHIAPTFDHFKKFVYHSFNDFDSFPQIGYVSHKKLYLKDMAKNNATLVQEILDEYDFIGINERFDESLVVLRLLLGLDAGDILYVSSKRNGGYDAGSMGGCHLVPKKVKWPEMDEYVSSYYWIRRFTFANALYAAANRSLDLTIERIGRDKFDKALSEHKRLMALVDEKCANTAVFPCSSDGKLQLEESEKDCYKFDYGCGYPCIDRVMEHVSKGVFRN